MAKADNANRGIVLMITATMVFSVQDALTKELVQHYPVLQILWVRYLLFATFALALSLRSRPLRQVFATARPAYQIARSLVMLVSLTCFALAVRVLPLADAHSLIAAAPLFATGLSVAWLGERVGIRRWLAVGVGFAGVLLILRPGFAALQPASLLVTGAAFLYAVYAVMTRVASRDDDGETLLLYMAATGAVLLTVIGPFFWVAPSGTAVGMMVALAFAGTVGHYLLIKALEAAPASLIQPFNYLMLVWATINGYLIFDDFPDLWTIAGGAVIVASGLYVIYRERVSAVSR
jgi:drug/metabolite transporter (DMT)-like permease